MGAESTSPCTRVKHRADLLRNKANSQQHPSDYEDRRSENIEDTEKADGRDCFRTKRSLGPAQGPGRLQPQARACPPSHRTPERELG